MTDEAETINTGKVSEQVQEKEIARWTFIHSLLKAIVKNAVHAIYSLSFGNMAKPKKAKEIVHNDIRRIYVAFMMGCDKWEQKRTKAGEKPYENDNITRARFGIQLMATIADSDWVYRELAEMIVNEHKRLTLNEIDAYAAQESGVYGQDESHKFVIKRRKG